jgi:hypothetical protein
MFCKQAMGTFVVFWGKLDQNDFLLSRASRPLGEVKPVKLIVQTSSVPHLRSNLKRNLSPSISSENFSWSGVGLRDPTLDTLSGSSSSIEKILFAYMASVKIAVDTSRRFPTKSNRIIGRFDGGTKSTYCSR